jgi:hypothetical protein
MLSFIASITSRSLDHMKLNNEAGSHDTIDFSFIVLWNIDSVDQPYKLTGLFGNRLSVKTF